MARHQPTQAPAGPSRIALVVLGMHRSGTSALAGMLGHLGATLPRHLMEPSDKNPTGYFEPEVLYRLHDEMLEEAGTRWDDPSPFPTAWFTSPSAKAWTRRMVELCHDEFGDSELFVLKDPRICRLVPFWEEVLRSFGAEPRYLVTVRNPLETARSLEAAEEDPEIVARLLWLDYFLRAENDTRDRPRCFVSYNDLLSDWRTIRKEIEKKLGAHLPRVSRRAESAVDAFLQGELRHQRVPDEQPLAERNVHPWVQTAYAWAVEAAGGKEPKPKHLDVIRAELATAEAAFGPALGASEAARHAERENFAAEQRQTAREQRQTAREIGETNRMLLHWIVDRVRGPDEPAPASLRAVMAAAEKADTRDIPAISATALVLADQKLAIEQLERELVARAQRIEKGVAQAAVREDEIRWRDETIERERAAHQHLLGECARLQAELDTILAKWREQKVVSWTAQRERDRLEAECSRLLEEASSKTPPDKGSEDR